MRTIHGEQHLRRQQFALLEHLHAPHPLAAVVEDAARIVLGEVQRLDRLDVCFLPPLHEGKGDVVVGIADIGALEAPGDPGLLQHLAQAAFEYLLLVLAGAGEVALDVVAVEFLQLGLRVVGEDVPNRAEAKDRLARADDLFEEPSGQRRVCGRGARIEALSLKERGRSLQLVAHHAHRFPKHLRIQMLEEAGHAGVAIHEQFEVEEPVLRPEHDDADVRELARLDEGGEANDGVVAEMLRQGTSQNVSSLQRERIDMAVSAEKSVGTVYSGSTNHHSAGVVWQIGPQFAKVVPKRLR